MVNRLLPAPGGAPRLVYGWDGTDWRALLVDAAGNLQVDVAASGLPTGAATAANQATMITALQLIDDLRTALESVGTDRLQVRGEDQLFSFAGSLAALSSGVISGLNGYFDSATPGAGEIWVVTNIRTVDVTNATTEHRFYVRSGGSDARFHDVVEAIAAGLSRYYHGHVYLSAGDVVRVYFWGGQVGDTVAVHLTGHKMTLET